MEEILRLFKAFPIFDNKTTENSHETLLKTLPKGFIFSPEVLGNYSDVNALIKMVGDEYGMTALEMNAAFHKSWNKIATASDEQLVMEQILHYITTYGFQSLGVYSDETVYIPNEKLDIPEIEKLKLVVIKGYTYPEIKEKLFSMLQTGIALKESTIKDVVGVLKILQNENIEITPADAESVKNKEVKIHLYDEYGLLPKNPTEFLRYVIYKSVDETLLIKSRGLIEKVKLSSVDVSKYFLSYKLEFGLEPLAEIFNRFKPLFLALKKSSPGMAAYVNKIRKLAVNNHKPMPVDYLNSITKRIKEEQNIDKTHLVRELEKVNTFRKVRLAYALNFRMKNPRSILYRIRNGKSYATEFDFARFEFSHLKKVDKVLHTVRESIVEDLAKNVKGKRILIPSNMVYSLPSTEKQFTGNLPTGSYIESDGDMIVGIHWENLDSKSVDLDLSMINQHGKIGWDGDYRDADRNVLFSGDITSAPKPRGATELFYVKQDQKVDFILNVCYYNHSPDEVPYKILVAQETPKTSFTDKNYMVDPNNVLAISKSVIKDKQTICGFMDTTGDKNRFYFVEASIGSSNSASNNPATTNARQYLAEFYKNMISLNMLLSQAGAHIVSEVGEEDEPVDIDLSPDALEKDTIINLLK